ncbi:MAG: hypothetical protein NTW21_17730 [Verrucomicrobia bacterium]|nr:hypothetical protein [Verrucomicrobiota bacterium]
MNTAKLAILSLMVLSVSAFGAQYTLNNGAGTTASGIETVTGATFRGGTVAGDAFSSGGGISAGPGIVAIGFFSTDNLSGMISKADLLASFTTFGAPGTFAAGGIVGNRSILSFTATGTVTGSVFSGRNIYLFVGNGTTFASSIEFLVVKTTVIFFDAQDGVPTAYTHTVRPDNSTLLLGTLVPNVKTTNTDTSITPGWGMGPSLVPLLAVTGVASDITATAATLNGMVTTYGVPTTTQFEYGLTTSYGSTAAGVTLSPDNGWSEQAVSASISGLQSGRIYHFRLTATNVARTNVGADMMFVTGNVLTTTAQHGMVAGAGDYPHGSTATLTATPDPGYVFTGWSGDATGTANPLSVLMDADKTITASFVPDTRDDDGDELTNYQEIVVYGTNPTLPDTDGDGLPDGAEVHTHGSNPLMVDTDDDGLNDRVEVEVYHSNPALKDSDGDGFDDLFEVNTGFDPTLATSTPDALSTIRTAVEFRFNAATGVSYRIEASSDLENWSILETDIIGHSAVVTRFYSTENEPQRFFRALRN